MVGSVFKGPELSFVRRLFFRQPHICLHFRNLRFIPFWKYGNLAVPCERKLLFNQTGNFRKYRIGTFPAYEISVNEDSLPAGKASAGAGLIQLPPLFQRGPYLHSLFRDWDRAEIP